MPDTASQPDILIRGLPSGYELEHLARVFFPLARLRTGTPSSRGELLYAHAGRFRYAVGYRDENRCIAKTFPLPAKNTPPKRALARMLYDLLCDLTGHRPPWGMLTGVRPVRLVRNTLANGGEDATRRLLRDRYDVSEEKYKLVRRVVDKQAGVLAASPQDSFSLYVSIPFCPTRCSYCSFVSQTIGREWGLIDGYLDSLVRELADTAAAVREAGLILESIYVGGGTPTSLSAAQLAHLLGAIAEHFDGGACKEYTVEAGRPDCTTPEKLRVLKEGGVGRIAINPQSFEDGVLRAIGRAHTGADAIRCFEEARAAGHRCINMDLIAGLPGDDPAGFERSLAQALALAPENITLHTLTYKRGTELAQAENAGSGSTPKGEKGAAGMLAGAYPCLAQKGYAPYYLYRQKGTVQNLENTGWTLPGREGVYNILMMEETRPVLAVGAGACTKLVAEDGRIIRRLYNHKYPADYIRDFEALRERKRRFFEAWRIRADAP